MTVSDKEFKKSTPELNSEQNDAAKKNDAAKEVCIDFSDIAGINDAHLRIAEALHFPAHYGKNLDALFDCLSEICVPIRITLSGTDALTAALGSYGAMILRVFSDVATENRDFTLVFVH